MFIFLKSNTKCIKSTIAISIIFFFFAFVWLRISRFVFLDRKKARENEAEKLIVQAFDFGMKKEAEISNIVRDKRDFHDFESVQKAIPADFFPPCIKIGLNGIEDGRKRFLFVIVNFLTSVGWDYEQIEKLLLEWNKKNYEPLRDGYIKAQVDWHKRQNKTIMPPNCSNEMYYANLGVKCTENICSKVKNPVNYAMRLLKQKDEPIKRPKKRKYNRSD